MRTDYGHYTYTSLRSSTRDHRCEEERKVPKRVLGEGRGLEKKETGRGAVVRAKFRFCGWLGGEPEEGRQSKGEMSLSLWRNGSKTGS